MVDLDPEGPTYPGGITLAVLASEGPRLDHLRPAGPGVRVLPNGGIDPSVASDVVDALIAGWPAVVLRVPQRAGPGISSLPIVAVRPVFPPGWSMDTSGCVVQSVGRFGRPAGDHVLPSLRATQVSAMLRGHVNPRWRWVRAWRPVWGDEWE
jgi:hypothetical protein